MSAGGDSHSLLTWQFVAGADEAVALAPVDRFATIAPIPPAAQALRAPSAPGLAHTTLLSARELAEASDSIAELRAALESFDGCALKETATNFVFADSTPGAPLMFVGEAPGAEEDRRGLPFVGPAGRLLDRMLAAIEMDRSHAYITNILPWRPPGNRNPTDSEIALCLPFVERHIALAQPRILVAVGGTAAKALLKTRDGIMRLRGRWFNHVVPTQADPIPLRAILHPAFLLRQPGQKREAWQDFLAIRQRLNEIGNSR